MEKHYKVNEVLDVANISLSTFYRHVKSGKINAVKVGSQWRVSETELNKYLGIYHDN